MSVAPEARAKWIFGTAPSGENGNVLGSTGTGTRMPFHGMTREINLFLETDAACTCSYQVIASRTLTGAQIVLSSGTMSTSQLDVLRLTGPWFQIYPRCKTINSTANAFVVELLGN